MCVCTPNSGVFNKVLLTVHVHMLIMSSSSLCILKIQLFLSQKFYVHASRCFIKSSSIYDHVLCVTVLPIQKLSKNNICILPPYYVFETTQGCIKHPYISLNETFFSDDDDDDDNAKVDVLYSLLLYNNEYYARKSFITKFSLSKLKAMMTRATPVEAQRRVHNGIECCCSF